MRVIVMAICGAAMVACGAECDSVTDCDPAECQQIRGRNLESNDPGLTRVAGCTSKDEGGNDVETGARSPDNECWLFPSSTIPASFTPDEGCARLAE
jgi:hypothetical protein